MKILILPNINKGNTRSLVSDISKLFLEEGCELYCQAKHLELFDCSIKSFEQLDMALELCDVVIAVGGDGTIIHAAKRAALYDKPVLGVNAGHFGFTAAVEPFELQKLRRFIGGEYRIERRMMLSVEILSAEQAVKRCFTVINDAVITKGALSRIINISVYHDRKKATCFRGDGLILGTPTGSTAYALSAGGPVIDPTIECITATPICPHTISARPIIFSPASVITVRAGLTPGSEFVGDQGEIYLTADGESPCHLCDGDIVSVRRSQSCASLVMLNEMGFAELLTKKFNS